MYRIVPARVLSAGAGGTTSVGSIGNSTQLRAHHLSGYYREMAEQIVPIFGVKDALKSAQWYSRLGFEIEARHQFSSGLPLYLFLVRGDSRLHLSEHAGDAKAGSQVYLYVHDVGAIASEFNVAIKQQPWAKEIALTDLDGNRLRIGQRKASGTS